MTRLTAVALQAMLHFTTPSRNAVTGGCGPSAMFFDSLAEVAVVSTAGDTLARKAAGLPGSPDSITFNRDGSAITVFAISRKQNSPWSCASNPVAFVSVVSVGPVVRMVADSSWHDVAGRRITGPQRSGVYFRRGKAVIVRGK